MDVGFLAFCSTLFTEISTRRIGKKGKAKPTLIHQNHAAARQHKHQKNTVQLFYFLFPHLTGWWVGEGEARGEKQRGDWGRTAPPPQPAAPSYRGERPRLQGGSPRARRPAGRRSPQAVGAGQSRSARRAQRGDKGESKTQTLPTEGRKQRERSESDKGAPSRRREGRTPEGGRKETRSD